MTKRQKVSLGQFLKEREGRYSPDDKALSGLERLNKIDFSGDIHLSGKGSKTDMIIVEPGDLVISGINVAKGAVAIYQGDQPITATIHYSSYTFDKEQIDIEYFKRFVKSQAFIKELEVRGGIKTEIKPKHFLPLEMNLPDIHEQRKTVDFFRRIEGEIADLGSEVGKQAEYLAKLRQSVLQEAIEGKLTKEWRKQNPKLISGENHASKLLEKIKAEKERLLEEGKIRKEKLLLVIADDEKLFELPNGWVWCRLAQLATKITDGTHFTPSYKDDGVQFVSAKDIKSGSLSFSNCKYISQDAHDNLYKRCNPEKLDLIVSKSGSIGTVVLNDFEHQFSLFESLALVKYLQGLMSPQYFKLALQFACNNLKREQIRGVAVKHLHLEVLRTLLIALPPFEEQQAVVNRVDKIMNQIDKLAMQAAQRSEQSEMLMQSVLREAFE
jgi:type I restriction enzyme S subunit